MQRMQITWVVPACVLPALVGTAAAASKWMRPRFLAFQEVAQGAVARGSVMAVVNCSTYNTVAVCLWQCHSK
jgi:hypothetical protein